MRIACWFSMVCLAVATAVAQNAPASHAPDRNGWTNTEGILIPPIPGAAFMAHSTLVIKTVLPNGATIQRQATMAIARDSMGRVYHEQRRVVPMSDQSQESPLLATIVFDGQEGTRTECDQVQRLCTITSGRAPQPQPSAPEGASKDGKFTLSRVTIGSETMEGVEVQHIREKRTYAAGVIGNDKPVAFVVDYWYSPLLQLDLAILRSNPQGTTMFERVTDLNLSEPEEGWFKLPPGFLVADARKRVVAPDAK
jgi:hypothetical protein